MVHIVSHDWQKLHKTSRNSKINMCLIAYQNHIYTILPLYLFGTVSQVSQSYLRHCLLGCSYCPPKNFLTHSSQIAHPLTPDCQWLPFSVLNKSWKCIIVDQQLMGLLVHHPCIRQYLSRTCWGQDTMLVPGCVGDGCAFQKLYMTSWSLNLLTCKTNCWD